MSFLGLSYQKLEYPGRGCSCCTLNYFPSYLPGYNCASAAKSSLSNNRMCNGSIQLLVSSVRRTRTPVNLPTVWGKVKEGGRRLGKIMPFSLTPLFTATRKKRFFSLFLIRWTLVKEKNNDTCVHGRYQSRPVYMSLRQGLSNTHLWSPYDCSFFSFRYKVVSQCF